MANVGLRKIIIYCTDLEKTKKFYEAIGLELHPDGGWTGLSRYFTRLEDGLNFTICSVGPGLTISNGLEFSVDNVPEVLKRLTAIQAEIVAPHQLVREKTNRAVVIDPDGRRIRLWNREA